MRLYLPRQDPLLGSVTLHMPALQKPETRTARDIHTDLQRHYYRIAQVRMHPLDCEAGPRGGTISFKFNFPKKRVINYICGVIKSNM